MKSKGRSLLARIQRAVLWLLGKPTRAVLTVGVAFAAYFLLIQVGPWHLTSDLRTLRVALAALVFGIFLGVVLISEEVRSPLEATLVRVFAGIVAGPAIAVLFSGSFLVLVGAGLVGAVLGYFGQSWASHL